MDGSAFTLTKCTRTCCDRDLPDMGECVRAVSATCENPKVGDLILEVAVEYILGLGSQPNGRNCQLQVINYFCCFFHLHF